MAQLPVRTQAGGMCTEELAMKPNAHTTEHSTKITIDNFGPHGGQPTPGCGKRRTFLKS